MGRAGGSLGTGSTWRERIISRMLAVKIAPIRRMMKKRSIFGEGGATLPSVCGMVVEMRTGKVLDSLTKRSYFVSGLSVLSVVSVFFAVNVPSAARGST